METKKGKVVDVIFLPNGLSAVFENHEQIPELQKSWFRMFVNFLAENGIDIMNSTFTFPDLREAKLTKTEDGYNWSFNTEEQRN